VSYPLRSAGAGIGRQHGLDGPHARTPGRGNRGASAVELIQARPHGTTVHLHRGGSVDFDLVVCADGYRSIGRRLIDPDATLHYRGMVTWHGLLPESDLRADPLDGCDLLRVDTTEGTGSCTTSPDPGRAPNRANAFSRGVTTSRFRRTPSPRYWSTTRSGSSPARCRSGRCIPKSRRASSPAWRTFCPRCSSIWSNRAPSRRSTPFTPLRPAATPVIACAWWATPVRCSPRSPAAASSRRWPMPPHWRRPRRHPGR
jgi:hypothetical protein